jgi:hypothetical protein
LRTTGQITDREFLKLYDEWRTVRPAREEWRTYTTSPTTWDQFAARRYPSQFIAYQAYLRLIGATPTPKKD